MARRASPQPTEAELGVLRVLWGTGPAELGRIRRALARPVALTTVATLLRVMLGKGLVRRKPGPRASVWSAAMTRENAASRMLRRLIEHVFEGSSKRLVTHMIEQGTLNAGDREAVRKMLQAYDARQRQKERR